MVPPDIMRVGATNKAMMYIVQREFKSAMERGKLLWDLQQCLGDIREAIKEHEEETTIKLIHVGETSIMVAMVTSVVFVKSDNVSKLTLVPETVYIVRNLAANIRVSFKCVPALIDWLSENKELLYRADGCIANVTSIHK